MIKLYNRKTKEYEIEKVAGEGLMKVLYDNSLGKVGLELLFKRKIYSALTGFLCDTGISASKIKSFVNDYEIDMNICAESIEKFKSFNEFFTRKLKPGARNYDTEPQFLLSPGDGRIRAWTNIDMNELIQVKGSSYTLKGLLADHSLAQKYQGGICMILRLAPVDYHRFHFMDSGICGESRKIKGDYYSVNPIALSTIPELFCRNKREYSIFRSDNFGDIIYMEVGATSVGSIIQAYEPEKPIARGDEKGYFKFGGSTIILFLEKGTAQIDEDILLQTELGYETRVFAAEIIGKKI